MKTMIIRIVLFSLFMGSSVCMADVEMNQITASDKAFFEQVRKAILADDFEWFSQAISYPIELHLNRKELHVKTKKELKKHTSVIFNKHLKKVIRAQSADSLFKNWQGIMVGQGDLWFSEVGEKVGNDGGLTWVYRITAINQTPDSEPPKK
jgi:hypothetical protein